MEVFKQDTNMTCFLFLKDDSGSSVENRVRGLEWKQSSGLGGHCDNPGSEERRVGREGREEEEEDRREAGGGPHSYSEGKVSRACYGPDTGYEREGGAKGNPKISSSSKCRALRLEREVCPSHVHSESVIGLCTDTTMRMAF